MGDMYDEPMSMEDLLADDERRRAALAYLGGGYVPPTTSAPTPSAATSPAVGVAAPRREATDFHDLAQRYLSAQEHDRRDALLSRAGAGLDSAARTINAGAGFDQPSMAVGGPEPSRAQGVEDAARIEALAKTTAPKTAAVSAFGTDADAQANMRALYPGAPDDVIKTVTRGNYEAVRKSLEGQAGRTERAGVIASTMEERKKDREQRAEQFAKSMGFKWSELDQEERLALLRLQDGRDARADAAAQKASEQATKDEKGQTVPAGEAASIGQANAALTALDVLGKQFTAKGASGVGGKAATLLPWDSDPKKYEDDVLAAAQAVGTILEGGKLAAGDEVKYRKMFPAAGDSPERARNKLENVKRLVESLTGAKVEALGAAGYNVSGFTPMRAAPQRTTPDKVLPKDAAGNPTLDGKRPVKETLSKDRKWKRITYSDGSTETVPNG